jgi:hypothetical protein
MCNLYSMTKNQAAIIALIRAMRDATGNLPSLPGIFPDYLAPIVRHASDERAGGRGFEASATAARRGAEDRRDRGERGRQHMRQQMNCELLPQAPMPDLAVMRYSEGTLPIRQIEPRDDAELKFDPLSSIC